MIFILKEKNKDNYLVYSAVFEDAGSLPECFEYCVKNFNMRAQLELQRDLFETFEMIDFDDFLLEYAMDTLM